jgi:hypothetical protein
MKNLRNPKNITKWNLRPINSTKKMRLKSL